MVREVPNYPPRPRRAEAPIARTRPGRRALANPSAQASEYHSSPSAHRRRRARARSPQTTRRGPVRARRPQRRSSPLWMKTAF
jgi:hypothetical protein